MSAAAARRDLADPDAIAVLLVGSYRRGFTDELLGPIFAEIARVDLSVHLPQATRITGSIRRRLHGEQDREAVSTEPRHPKQGPS